MLAWFGKLPGAADFVVHGLNPERLAAIEQWLERWMLTLSAQPNWRETYLNMPALGWLPPVQLAQHQPCCMGVLMPSVDRVGRLYPFLMLLEHQPNQADSPPLAHLAQALQLGQHALALDWGAAELADALRTADWQRPSTPPEPWVTWPDHAQPRWWQWCPQIHPTQACAIHALPQPFPAGLANAALNTPTDSMGCPKWLAVQAAATRVEER